ncbi:MAG: FecR domain-containing protein [Leptospiraceae bacterium]|nr:FecR domain-containing protein [Leptospiraceae bacterium]
MSNLYLSGYPVRTLHRVSLQGILFLAISFASMVALQGDLGAAPENAAVLSRIDGDSASLWLAPAARPGAWRALKRGALAPVGSLIKTGPRTHAILVYKGLEFRVGPASVLAINELVQRGKSSLTVQKGAAWFHLQKNTDQQLDVHTPTSLAAVRGTKFAIMATGSAGEQGKACVCEGTIAVGTNKDGDNLQELHTGQSLQWQSAGSKMTLYDYSKLFKGRQVDPAFLKRKEAASMQYCLSCHKPGKADQPNNSPDFSDY